MDDSKTVDMVDIDFGDVVSHRWLCHKRRKKDGVHPLDVGWMQRFLNDGSRESLPKPGGTASAS